MSGLCAGIFAAGEGSRLKPGLSADIPKPLAPVAGVPLCHWVARGLIEAGATHVTLLTNSRGGKIAESLAAAFPKISWAFLSRDTASSWESFRLVARELATRGEDMMLSTADALLPPGEAARFAEAARKSRVLAALALTEHIDDEKPLWAETDGRGMISALGEDAGIRRYATAGLYLLRPALAEGFPGSGAFGALRGYWTRCVRELVPVQGIVLKKVLDVDRPEDLAEAQGFARSFA